MADMIDGAVAEGSHISADTERPVPGIDLSDDLLDKLFEGSDTGDAGDRAPARTKESPARKAKDTRSPAEDDSDDDLGDTDDDGEEGSEDDDELDRLLDDEDEDEEDLDEDEESDEEEPAEFLSEFNRKKFLDKYKDNPDVMAAYKSMQADYTRGKMALSDERKELEARASQADEVKEQYTTFAKRLQSDEGMSEFLVNVALHRSDVFEKAYEQALSLNEDEGQKTQYLREQKLKEREEKLEKADKVAAQQKFQARIGEIESLTQRAAARLGLKSESQIEIAEQFVANAIHDARAATGKPDISNEQVVAAVKAAAKKLGVTMEQAKKQAAKELRLKRNADTRAKAKDARRPAAPRGGRPPLPSDKSGKPDRQDKRFVSDDPLDSIVDNFFNA